MNAPDIDLLGVDGKRYSSFDNMKRVARAMTGSAPKQPINSIGCSIKWKK